MGYPLRNIASRIGARHVKDNAVSHLSGSFFEGKLFYFGKGFNIGHLKIRVRSRRAYGGLGLNLLGRKRLGRFLILVALYDKTKSPYHLQ